MNKLSLSPSPAFDPQSNPNPTTDQTLVEHLPIPEVVPSTRMARIPCHKRVPNYRELVPLQRIAIPTRSFQTFSLAMPG